MLQIPNHSASNSSSQRSDTGMVPQLDLLALFRICYRQWPILLGALILSIGLGSVYLATAQKKYTATFRIMVDTRKNDVLARQDIGGDRQLDPGQVESQVEILKSDGVANAVVKDLNLTADKDFMGSPGLVSRLMSTFRKAGPPSQEDLTEAAVNRLIAGISVKRIGVTYVIEVDYTGTNPQRAAQIASAWADAYMVGELDARFQASQRASQWLEARINELRDQSNAADLAVQRFKSENNIVDTARGLMSEQQLSDVNGQLVAARAATAEAKARYDRVEAVLGSDITDGTVSDALRSEVINRLRAQYLDVSVRRAGLIGRYGANHRAVIDMTRQMEEIQRTAREELQRVAQSAKSDYEIAQAREASLTASLDRLVSEAGSSNEAQVKLRDLESSALSYRNLYDNFLQKYQESTQEQTFPVINARMITPASVPNSPSSPKSTLVFAASIVFGLGLGLAAALGRELLGNKFRTPEDVNNFAGLECLGTLPKVSEKAKRRSKALQPVPGPGHSLGMMTPVSRNVIMAPFSRFTETIRNVKVSVDIARGANRSCVIGVTSSVPGEGKTTFSSNLAFLIAQMGHKVLLIDGDMHSPSLTKALEPSQQKGLVELLNGSIAVDDIIRRDSATGLDFIPTVVDERQANIVSLLTSQRMQELLTAARANYEYVIVDLPPVVPVVDVKASTAMFDSYLFVIEWGATSRDAVRDAMLQIDAVRPKFIGAILNKVDPSELKRLEAYRGSNYGNYYVEPDAA